MERCPVCRARLKERQQCRRCGTDLTSVIAMEQKAEMFFVQAIRCLQSSDINTAKTAIENAVLIHNKQIYQKFSGFIMSLASSKQ